MLERDGFLVDTAVDPRQAAELIGGRSYALVVVDALMMPTWSVPELISSIRSGTGGASILVVAQQGQELGQLDPDIVVVTVEKRPVDPYDLTAVLGAIRRESLLRR